MLLRLKQWICLLIWDWENRKWKNGRPKRKARKLAKLEIAKQKVHQLYASQFVESNSVQPKPEFLYKKNHF